LRAPHAVSEEFTLPDCGSTGQIALENIDSLVAARPANMLNVSTGMALGNYLKTEIFEDLGIQFSKPLIESMHVILPRLRY
jgi:hypothetical protein